MMKLLAPWRYQHFSSVKGTMALIFMGGTGISRGADMAKYGKKAGEKVEKAMHEKKRGTLKSGRSGKKVKSRKQAIAIGLSQARKAGAKVPRKTSKK
jgi:hypothetical protein